MDPEKNIDEVIDTFDTSENEVSVDDFIKQLEEKEKDLHITSDTSIIEIAEAFEDEDGEIPEFLKATVEQATGKAAAAKMIVEHAAKPDNVSVKKLETEVGTLKASIAKMEADRDEMFKNSQRRSKDFDAFKTRAERERRETFENQISNLATLMLPALDNLHRALESAEDLPGGKTDAFQDFYDGIAIVSEQINDILNKMGIKPIRTVGEEFDPHYHEAVATEETDDHPPNTVCGELLRGYIAGDRVIRHSMVRVAMPSVEQKSVEDETEVDELFDPPSDK